MTTRLIVTAAAFLLIGSAAQAAGDVHSAPLFNSFGPSEAFVYVWNYGSAPVTVTGASITDISTGLTVALGGNTCTAAIPAHQSCHFFASDPQYSGYGATFSVVGAPIESVRGWFFLETSSSSITTASSEMH